MSIEELDIAELRLLLSARENEIKRLRAENAELRRALDVVPGTPTAEDIEWAEQVAALQASSGYEASIAQVEIERLRAEVEWLREVVAAAAPKP